jgi:hypothetical protein
MRELRNQKIISRNFRISNKNIHTLTEEKLK